MAGLGDPSQEKAVESPVCSTPQKNIHTMLWQVLRLRPLQKQHLEIDEPMGQEAICLRGECLPLRARRVSDLHAGHARLVGCARRGAGPPHPGPTHVPPA